LGRAPECYPWLGRFGEREVPGERAVFVPAGARRMGATSQEESIEIDSLRDRFNAGLLLAVPGQRAFCTLCVKPLSAPPMPHGDGRMQCTECGKAVAIHPVA
jgi:hypothetical protein